MSLVAAYNTLAPFSKTARTKLVRAVDAGDINVTVGSRIAKLEDDQQSNAVALVKDGTKPIEALRITKVNNAIETH